MRAGVSSGGRRVGQGGVGRDVGRERDGGAGGFREEWMVWRGL